MVLASGQRAGFFIGDGAGVGKGRQVGVVPYRKQNSLLLNSCGLLPWRHRVFYYVTNFAVPKGCCSCEIQLYMKRVKYAILVSLF